MRIRVCHLNRVDKMSLIIFRNLHLSIEFTIVVFLPPLHTEEYPFSVKYALYYIYFIKTHHSIFYIVLINSYDMFIENITLPILNRHKNSRVGKSWNFDDIITNSSYHHKCRNLHIFAKNHTCLLVCIVYHIVFIQIMLCRHCRGLSFVLSVMYLMMYNSLNLNLTLNKSFIRRLPDIYEKSSPFYTNIYKFNLKKE